MTDAFRDRVGHTSGPWEVRANGMFLRVVHGEHKTTVADGIVSEANALLIAAATELLALAHQYRNDMLYPVAPDSKERRIAAIDAVLAKIEATS